MRRRGRRLRSAAVLLAIVGGLIPSSPAAAERTKTIQGVQVLQDVQYGDDRGPLLMDVYMPSTGGSAHPAVIFLHGGGWFAGGKSVCRKDGCIQLAQMGWVGISIDYNLQAPRWPNQLHDVQTAIGFVRTNASRYGVDPDQIALIGSSAGANLAAEAGVIGQGSLTTGSRVRAVVTWSAPMDLAKLISEATAASCSAPADVCADRQKKIPDAVQGYVGCPPDSCPQTYADASPVSHVDPSDPAMLIANSTDEIIPLDQATEMGGLLQKAGVPEKLVQVPGSAHAEAYQSTIWPDTVAWLQQYLGGGRTIPPPTSHTSSPTEGPSGGGGNKGGSGSTVIVVAAVIVAVVLLSAIASLSFRRRT